MIVTEGLTFHYDGDERPVLRDINLTIGDGEYLSLIGPNGCGKSTLIQHFNALLLPSAGTVSVDGQSSGDHREVQEIRRRVGMVFQNPDNQIVGMTVEEDIAFGPGNLGLPPSEIRTRVDECLRIAGIGDLAQRAPHTLSGGEKRLVTIAGVLAMKPRYIALDEPTSYLDPAGKERVLAVIRKLHQEGIGIVHITHDMEEITAADRVAVMQDGQIRLTGTPEEIVRHVELLKAMGLGIPKATELMWQLKNRGGNVRTDVLTIEDACDEIASWIGNALPAPSGDKKGRNNLA
jgi:biotin transport system ATP-binding protein/energy-coupling factor transport system ATP-binding protein